MTRRCNGNPAQYERNRRFRHLVYVLGWKANGAKLPSEGIWLNASKSESRPNMQRFTAPSCQKAYIHLRVKMPHARQRRGLSINDGRGSCATALALATRRPIICRRLSFRSGCCKYVEQCKTAIYWDLALDFTLVRLRRTAFIFSTKWWVWKILIDKSKSFFGLFFQILFFQVLWFAVRWKIKLMLGNLPFIFFSIYFIFYGPLFRHGNFANQCLTFLVLFKLGLSIKNVWHQE